MNHAFLFFFLFVFLRLVCLPKNDIIIRFSSHILHLSFIFFHLGYLGYFCMQVLFAYFFFSPFLAFFSLSCLGSMKIFFYPNFFFLSINFCSLPNFHLEFYYSSTSLLFFLNYLNYSITLYRFKFPPCESSFLSFVCIYILRLHAPNCYVIRSLILFFFF